jgi:hypothetical protein
MAHDSVPAAAAASETAPALSRLNRRVKGHGTFVGLLVGSRDAVKMAPRQARNPRDVNRQEATSRPDHGNRVLDLARGTREFVSHSLLSVAVRVAGRAGVS